MGEFRKGLPIGFRHSFTTRMKMGESAMRRGISEETRRKMLIGIRKAARRRVGVQRSEETRMKISMAQKGKVVPYGVRKKIAETLRERSIGVRYVMTDEIREKMSRSHAGVKLSSEHRLACSVAAKRRKSYLSLMTVDARKKMMIANHARTGIAHTVEHNEKISSGVTRAYIEGRIPYDRDYACEYAGRWFRSGWEAKFAKWCDDNGRHWKYEDTVFKCSRGTYIPDFHLVNEGCFVEVKGRYFENAVRKMNDFVNAGYDLRVIDVENIDNIHLNKRWNIGGETNGVEE